MIYSIFPLDFKFDFALLFSQKKKLKENPIRGTGDREGKKQKSREGGNRKWKRRKE